ncbi:MAG: GNAT family N-acetyltransferase [Firmicutes bacterium]|nr:GNAT family N-acetyltransferase [Bacillota bacterium]
MHFRQARPDEFFRIRRFYHDLTDRMQNAAYAPGWIKDVYPSPAMLRQALQKGELYLATEKEALIAAMIVNDQCTDGYQQADWPSGAGPGEVLTIHALGVDPRRQGQGLGKQMIAFVMGLAKAKGAKALRVDVLDGNMPALRLYPSLGFLHAGSIELFYENTGLCRFILFELPL